MKCDEIPDMLREIAAELCEAAKGCPTWQAVRAINQHAQRVASIPIYGAITYGMFPDIAPRIARVIAVPETGHVNWYGIRKSLGLTQIRWMDEFDVRCEPTRLSANAADPKPDGELLEWYVRQSLAWSSTLDTLASHLVLPVTHSTDGELRKETHGRLEDAESCGSPDPEKMFRDIADGLHGQSGRLARFLATKRLPAIAFSDLLTAIDPLGTERVFKEDCGLDAVKSAVKRMDKLTMVSRVRWSASLSDKIVRKKIEQENPEKPCPDPVLTRT